MNTAYLVAEVTNILGPYIEEFRRSPAMVARTEEAFLTEVISRAIEELEGVFKSHFDIPVQGMKALKYTDEEYTKINDYLTNKNIIQYVPDQGHLYKGKEDLHLSSIVERIVDETNKWKVWGEEKEAALNLALEGNQALKEELDQAAKDIEYLDEERKKANERAELYRRDLHQANAKVRELDKEPKEITITHKIDEKQKHILTGLAYLNGNGTGFSLAKHSNLVELIKKALS